MRPEQNPIALLTLFVFIASPLAEAKKRAVSAPNASFYVNSSPNRDGSRYRNGDRHCAVHTSKWSALKGHTLLITTRGQHANGRSIKCLVRDTGGGVRGVDLTPADWKELGYSTIDTLLNKGLYKAEI